jgi:flagellar biosynthesis protein FlhA
MPETTQQPGTAAIPRILNNSDILLAVGVVAVVSFMVIPLPTFLLDLLLSFNITFALIILLVGMYILKPMDMSAFPSILLLVTLFRLALNIASTRIILLNGSDGVTAAGKVIHSFGSFVVGGNYIVGVIVFLILVVINFMVITKGAGRIAEVAARFTLDAMPGKQMSIDADLNAGLIDDAEARERRRQINAEAEYYGAMDGANKFVRGDAIAGILITLINIIGGFAIGVFQNEMSFGEAAQTYTLLTVGDGLVTQIPALIISTAAGIIVSRAGSESNLGRDITSQLFLKPRAIGIAAVVLLGFALVPGMPTLPFLFLAVLAGSGAYFVHQAQKANRQQEEEVSETADSERTEEALHALPTVDMIALEVGYGLIPLVDRDQNGELLERIKSIRRQIAQDIGLVVAPIHIQDNMQLKPGEYVILLKGNEIARGELMINHYLAMNPGNVEDKLEGIPTREPTYGLPAYWIKDEMKESTMAKGYTVVDLATVLTTHLSDIIQRHAHELIGRQEVQAMLDNLKESHPKVVEELVPNLMPLGGVVKVLQGLLREQVPIRDLLTILESLADMAPTIKDLDLLKEFVRQALARTITSLYLSADGRIPLVQLGQSIEDELAASLQQTDQGSYLVIEPEKANTIITALSKEIEKMTAQNHQPVLLCSARIRSHFKKFIDRFIPTLTVLSYEELMSNVQIHSLGTVEM